MTFNYPNGQPYTGPQRPAKASLQSRASNRGMTLEGDINVANQYYRDIGRAVIHKKPTPVQIVKVHYPERAAAKITEAYFTQASTTDYNGIYLGRYIDFDAKETAHKQSFPLKNVHAHQVAHLRQIQTQQGLAVFIIRFTARQETFVIPATLLFQYWDNQETGRKSIPYDAFVTHGVRVTPGLQISTPYLDAIDQLLAKGEQNG
ncbi:Holliday junction resolvase RecU [Weissella tructae]|uniref:Holliday junction resolvase RecU n=2 Tax=Weissella TaxID=46255 RepID=A0A075U604_9LACO|nr:MULTISPECIES: Holliday junction resolvase RecU [Weissella]AIG65547.1 Holliday junction resolvase RecU [Weissella tructae]AIM62861.1 Holliday junction resolvase RecU [Weissella ceti]AIM64259.1 Holliday junction resolvase RecU [Weissella ceti]ELA06993.1 Holliday junction-specific endonuclease [Weissella ceti NC36]QVV91918.1 Holliday junction resolvase RecU [Weissella tructae]